MQSKDFLIRLIKDQKSEINVLLEGAIRRDKLSDLINIDSKMAIIVKGVRRSGKSTFLLELVSSKYNQNFYYFNFDDERLIDFTLQDFQTLLEAFYQHEKLDKDVFLFDEIQNIKGWELFVNRLLRQGSKIYISGSNSDLLSAELGTHLTGRHLDFEIYPFSFKEFLDFYKYKYSKDLVLSTSEKSKILNYFNKYINMGGMPESLRSGSLALKNIFSDIIEKDIIRRYNIRNSAKLRNLIKYILSVVPEKFSYKSIGDALKIDDEAIQKYIKYAEDTYLLFTVEKYEKKTKLLYKNQKKIYGIDNGLILANSVNVNEQKGWLLENLVASELKRRNKALCYYVTKNGKEVDFVTYNNLDIKKKIDYLIQVSYEINSESTRKREESSLIEAMNETNLKCGYIITMDYEDTKKIDSKKIEYLPAWKFLLSDKFK
ncbi:MAG: ATP-binding protein [archaeon]